MRCPHHNCREIHQSLMFSIHLRSTKRVKSAQHLGHKPIVCTPPDPRSLQHAPHRCSTCSPKSTTCHMQEQLLQTRLAVQKSNCIRNTIIQLWIRLCRNVGGAQDTNKRSPPLRASEVNILDVTIRLILHSVSFHHVQSVPCGTILRCRPSAMQ